jgi:hypothetical protein
MRRHGPAALPTHPQNELTQMTPNTTNPASPSPDDIRDLSESEGDSTVSGAIAQPIDDEKRSSAHGFAQMVEQMAAAQSGNNTRDRRVGGRHSSPPASGGRGGYQDKCDVFEFRRRGLKNHDPRLDELATMGLQNYWLEVAEALGFDAFLVMWRILDSYKDIIPSKGSYATSIYPTLRNYASYLRFQKNRFVENLAAQGVPPREIQIRVKTQLCEYVSIVHINRLAKKNKINR